MNINLFNRRLLLNSHALDDRVSESTAVKRAGFRKVYRDFCTNANVLHAFDKHLHRNRKSCTIGVVEMAVLGRFLC